MFEIIKLLRIHQWVKNFFIFLPLFFDKQLGDWTRLSACLFAFLGFSLLTGAIYCLNDIIDVNDDRKHPKKRNRPIACGKISVKTAWVIIGLLLIAGFCILFFGKLPSSLILVVLFYLILNIAYCFKLKKIAIIDVFIIGIGFIIRILIGGIAGDVILSQWIVIMTFLLAIFLGFAKRLDDVRIYTDTGIVGRRNIIRYNETFLNALLIITTTITIVAYIMYTVSEEVVSRFGSDYVYITSIFVILGIFRYLQLTIVDNKSGSPTKILIKDRFIQVCILLWICSFAVIIYVI
ncbi:MAG: decaprenyl-phosphate phosphoribosyltransferase [Dysgonamonadaceae bacterium]|jgi:4-hydroxybenzoate polyprenyltransferase|nr:decaprenyl-phosphate phosphoribosyltransferase [Dysgonamonadaceae bacterium]